LRQALRRDGLINFTGKRVRQFTRAFVFRRDEVIVFCISKDSDIRKNFVAPDVEVIPFRFSALADAALQHASYLGPDRLQSFRQRLAAGDRGVIALYRGHVAHVAWVGRRNSIIATSETGPRCVLQLSYEVSVIYDCWTPEEFRGMGIYPLVLRSLLQEELRSGREVWIYCLRKNEASRAGIQKVGFVEAARLIRIVLFGRLERCRVIRLDRTETESPVAAARES
jgi:L-amino acid N-acyltransferase YncA